MKGKSTNIIYYEEKSCVCVCSIEIVLYKLFRSRTSVIKLSTYSGQEICSTTQRRIPPCAVQYSMKKKKSAAKDTEMNRWNGTITSRQTKRMWSDRRIVTPNHTTWNYTTLCYVMICYTWLQLFFCTTLSWDNEEIVSDDCCAVQCGAV